MKFLEKDLEDIIFETPNEALIERGLEIYGQKRRQVRIGNYGIADIITRSTCFDFNYTPSHSVIGKFDREKTLSHCVNIYELKKGQVNDTAVKQALRYVNGVKDYLNKRSRFDFNVKITLIGDNVSETGLTSDLPNMFEDISIYVYKYTYQGILFSRILGYKLVDGGF